AGVRGAVQEQEHPRSVQAGRGRRRNLARDDHHHERHARNQEQRAADRARLSEPRGGEVRGSIAATLLFTLLFLFLPSHAHAQATPAPQGGGAAAQPKTPGAKDAWNFDDEEEKEPTLA